MIDQWRKIEAALDRFFETDGWSIETRDGDHFAFCQSCSNDEFDYGTQISVNTTECAKRIAAEVAC